MPNRPIDGIIKGFLGKSSDNETNKNYAKMYPHIPNVCKWIEQHRLLQGSELDYLIGESKKDGMKQMSSTEMRILSKVVKQVILNHRTRADYDMDIEHEFIKFLYLYKIQLQEAGVASLIGMIYAKNIYDECLAECPIFQRMSQHPCARAALNLMTFYRLQDDTIYESRTAVYALADYVFSNWEE